jgi:Fungal Zn(2)-Cys(6) binuclear cluster domain
MPKVRQTCTQCSMRRQKCDKQLPCGRCIKRGETASCTREWPGEYDPKKHRVYPRSSDGVSPASKTPPPANARTPTAGVAANALRTLSPSQPTLGSQGDHVVINSSISNGSNIQPPVRSNPAADIENAPSVLEFLSWGRSKLSDFDVKAPELLKEPHNSSRHMDGASSWELANGFGGTGTAQMSFLQLLLPSRKQVVDMVEYHNSSILWYHGSYHGHTFCKELAEVYQSPGGLQIRDMDLQWAALLFSIMAASMTCASDQTATGWGFQKAERTKLTHQWFKATTTCLHLSGYMLRHHIYSVQAIATLTMSAHILGYSNEQSVLLGVALKIAQSLGLQRLGPDVDDIRVGTESLRHVISPAHRERLVKRETGRRLWLQLCIQDWFSIPFSEMYSINRPQFSTIKPANCDEETLEALPEDIPTNTSFANYLYEIAALMPQIHDATVGSNTLYTKYQHVLDFDAKMRALATDGMPHFFSMREGLEASWPTFVPWARRSLTICFAHKIIMIHRSFLGRSFTNHAFAFTRRTCIAAAKTILKEAKQAYDEEGPLLWIDQAFMVAAGITLSLDIFHRNEQEQEFEEHRKLVQNTIRMLGKFDNSMIAVRGMRLLSSLLTEQARLAADQALDQHRKRSLAGGSHEPNAKRQKFDIPKFVENFYSDDSFTQSLKGMPKAATDSDVNQVATTQEPSTDPAIDNSIPADFGYETFAELFPPQTGISNAFLFEDLLNFDLM